MWCPTSCRILEKVIGTFQIVSFIISMVPLTLVSNIVDVQTCWLATPTLPGKVTVMIGNILLALFFAPVLDHWYSPLRKRRLSYYQWLNMSIMVFLMLALRIFGSEKYWVSLGFLLRPQILFIVKIKVKFRSLTILLKIVRWSMLKFISITWELWFKRRFSLLFITKPMIISLTFSWVLFRNKNLLSFVLCLVFKKLLLWGECTNVISPPKSLECCVDGGVLEP